MYIIAKDGTGDFTSLQQAVDFVPGGGQAPTILLVRPGVYEERVVVNKDNLRIIGEDRDRTVITARGCAKDLYPDGTEKGTFLSATFLVAGDNVEVENLTIRNDAGDGRQVGQAVAVYAAGDRGVWRNVRMIAHQDTLFCGPVQQTVLDEIAPRRCRAEFAEAVNEPAHTQGRQYFEDCFIQGDVDFIFGSYRCWFERCTLFMNARGGYYTAANTPEDQPHGFVFRNCKLTGECEAGKALLGRPWRRFARTVFLDCEMDECVAPQGFCDWDDIRVVTGRMGEYGTTGARADQSARHPAQKRITAEEAEGITLQEVLGGWDQWQPDRRVPTWFLCGDSTMAYYAPDRAPMMGWGQKLQTWLNMKGIHEYVEDCAVNGRSSKSFIDEQRLAHIIPCLRPGDRMVVCFSHNDEKPDPARGTTPHGTFPEYMSMFIDAALKHGAEPILSTPIARRHFSDEGRLIPTHGEFPDAIRDLAARRGVRLIDLEKATMRLVQEAGPEGSRQIYCHVPAGSEHYPDGLQDNSHLREEGASRIARLFLDRYLDSAFRDADFDATGTDDCDDLIAREDSVYDKAQH